MRKVFVAAALMLSLTPGTGAAATIFSDDFDTENGGVGALNYNAFANFAITNGTVDLIPLQGGVFDFLPGNGLYVDLDGSTGDAGIQTANGFVLGPGNYVLTFDLAGSQRPPSPSDTVRVDVFGLSGTYGSLSQTLPYTQGFTTYSIPFTVLAPDTVQFRFADAGSDNQGALLDRVRLQTPEPATLLLLGLATAGFGLRRRIGRR